LGRRKVKSEEELKNMMLPVANDVLGIAEKMLGYDKLKFFPNTFKWSSPHVSQAI